MYHMSELRCRYLAANARGRSLGFGDASGIVPTSPNARNGAVRGVQCHAVNDCFCVDLCGKMLYLNVASVHASTQKAFNRPEFESAERAALRMVWCVLLTSEFSACW